MDMGHRVLAIDLFLVSVSILLFTACGGDCKSVYAQPKEHLFIQPVYVSPYKKIYHVGDTIQFGFTDTGKILFDSISRGLVKADSLQYGVRASISSLDRLNEPIPSPGDFFTSDNGSPYYQNTTGNPLAETYLDTKLSYCEGGPDFHYFVGIIPRHTGVYYFHFFFPDQAVFDCYNGSPYPVYLQLLFGVPDCNEDLLAGLSLNAQDSSLYRNDLLTKMGYLFKVE